MTPTAIHEAIRLYKYPIEMAWICQSSATLPNGVTELLQLSSSQEKISVFAEKNHTNAIILQKMLFNFIENVLLNENNSNEKLLGLDGNSDPELLKLHYQLLIGIFHPDRNHSSYAAEYTSKITKAYKRIKHKKNISNEFKNIRISRVPPKSFYLATSKAEQEISNIKGASIAFLAVTVLTAVWIGGYFYKPNSVELFSQNSSFPNGEIKKESFRKEQETHFLMAKHGNITTSFSKQDQFQELLRNIEIAYEKGDAPKIQTILNSPEIKQQSDKEVLEKLKKLFQITSDRKMLLYNFEWSNVSGQIEGKGKFLSRYHLNGNNQWLTREGVASILAIESENVLNIKSLKLNNKNIDQ